MSVDRAILEYLFRAPAAEHFVAWQVAHQFDLPPEHVETRVAALEHGGLVSRQYREATYLRITQLGRNAFLASDNPLSFRG